MYSYTARKLELKAHNAQCWYHMGFTTFHTCSLFPTDLWFDKQNDQTFVDIYYICKSGWFFGLFLAVVLTSRLRKAGSTNISLHAKVMGSHEYHSFIIIDAVPPAKTHFPKVSPPWRSAVTNKAMVTRGKIVQERKFWSWLSRWTALTILRSVSTVQKHLIHYCYESLSSLLSSTKSFIITGNGDRSQMLKKCRCYWKRRYHAVTVDRKTHYVKGKI